MDSDKYLEGQSMQRPPLFESDSFIYWKNRFETYVKSKDLDLWHVITNGDFQPIIQNPETKLDEVVPFEKQTDDLKRRLAKNNEAKMVIYNALPRKEYERIFMCNTAKEIWKTLLITHQEHIIVARAENRPPMLEKSMYDSRASRIRLFIKGKKHGRMMLDSIDNDDCDVQATNIILHGLPPDVYELVNHQEAAKDIWDRVKLLMKGTELSYQECECRLYNLFDKFAYQVQVNTKFLNALPSEWSKFVTDVKLAKRLYTTNYDQLYAYLSQHKRHVNEVCIMCERYSDPLALVANSPTIYNPSQSPQHSGSLMYPHPQQFTQVYAAPIHHQHHHTPANPKQYSVSPQPFISPSVTQQSQAEFPQLDSSLAVPMFQQGEDPIECINKAMAFLSIIASRFPP
ncbi:hypothetical protein Tco_1009821 [Tanacetum coccineum]